MSALRRYQRAIVRGYERSLAADDIEAVREWVAMQGLLDELALAVNARERQLANAVFAEFADLATCMAIAAAC